MKIRAALVQLQPQRLVRVIRDTRDGKLDYFILGQRAVALFEAGKLYWDVTNQCYGTNRKDRVE
jgi:hypothetical protein